MPTPSLEQDDYFSDSVATFGDRLQAAREAKGLTVESLAGKLGVEAEKVETWENDADAPRASRVQMLAGLLDVSIVWLISGESNGTTHVADTFNRPFGVNDTLGEIAELKAILTSALVRLEQLESRLSSGSEKSD